MLACPKFRLTPEECEDLLADYLPWCESVKIPKPAPARPACRDPFDVAFLELALAGRADFLVTGDQDLLSLAAQFSCPILKVDPFLKRL